MGGERVTVERVTLERVTLDGFGHVDVEVQNGGLVLRVNTMDDQVIQRRLGRGFHAWKRLAVDLRELADVVDGLAGEAERDHGKKWSGDRDLEAPAGAIVQARLVDAGGRLGVYLDGDGDLRTVVTPDDAGKLAQDLESLTGVIRDWVAWKAGKGPKPGGVQ